MLFPASKKAPLPLQIPGYAPAFKFGLQWFDIATVNFLAAQGATGVERLRKGVTDHQRLRTTGLKLF